MGRNRIVTTPHLERIFAQLGENIRLARLRRRFSAAIVAERAGIARNTLRAIERGESNVTIGAYVSVLNSLGLENDLTSLARDDELGRKLQDAGLPTKARAPRIKRPDSTLKKNVIQHKRFERSLKKSRPKIETQPLSATRNSRSVKTKHE